MGEGENQRQVRVEFKNGVYGTEDQEVLHHLLEIPYMVLMDEAPLRADPPPPPPPGSEAEKKEQEEAAGEEETVRIYQAAKQFGVDSRVVCEMLGRMGHKGLTASNAIPVSLMQQLNASLMAAGSGAGGVSTGATTGPGGQD